MGTRRPAAGKTCTSVAKLSMMNSAAVCMVCSQLDRILRVGSHALRR
jgi:hypothetical protein